MIILRKSSATAFVFLIVLSLLPGRARAETTFADSALTVALSTVAGAVLGASTLPFYEDSGEHTKNIFYGAALGAVVGVLVSAYSGIKEGPNYDDARLKITPESKLSINDSVRYRLNAEATTARRKSASFGDGSTLVWSPVAQFRF